MVDLKLVALQDGTFGPGFALRFAPTTLAVAVGMSARLLVAAVNRDAQDNLVLLVGATMLSVGLSDLHLRYVEPAIQPLIVMSGVVLLVLGLRGLVRVYREVMATGPTGPARSTITCRHGPPRPRWDRRARPPRHDQDSAAAGRAAARPLLRRAALAGRVPRADPGPRGAFPRPVTERWSSR